KEFDHHLPCAVHDDRAGSFDSNCEGCSNKIVLLRRCALPGWLRHVVEHRREPALGLGESPAFALRVVLDLVALDLADPEVAGFRVAEIKPAHGGTRPHRKALGELHAKASI